MFSIVISSRVCLVISSRKRNIGTLEAVQYNVLLDAILLLRQYNIMLPTKQHQAGNVMLLLLQ